MYLYQCFIPADSLDYETKVRVAGALADIHSEVTWVPRELVEVVFVDCAPMLVFGGDPLGDALVTITVHAGHDRGTNADLAASVAAAWRALTRQQDVLVELIEIGAALTCVSIGVTPRPRTEPLPVQNRSRPVGFVGPWYVVPRSAGGLGAPVCSGYRSR